MINTVNTLIKINSLNRRLIHHLKESCDEDLSKEIGISQMTQFRQPYFFFCLFVCFSYDLETQQCVFSRGQSIFLGSAQSSFMVESRYQPIYLRIVKNQTS